MAIARALLDRTALRVLIDAAPGAGQAGVQLTSGRPWSAGRPPAPRDHPVRPPASQGSGLLVVINNDGRGMTPRTGSPGIGVGLALIARLSSTVEIDGDGAGTRLAMRFAPTP